MKAEFPILFSGCSQIVLSNFRGSVLAFVVDVHLLRYTVPRLPEIRSHSPRTLQQRRRL
jgi:hypothetical protein